MITQDGWLDWAERRPGPPDKVYTQRNTAEWFLPHSAVGYYNGWASRLFDISRLADGSFTPNAAASVHGWVEQDGRVYQHYPFTASCWASGNRIPNTRGIAFEHAGGPPSNLSEPLTPEQVDADVRILKELAVWAQRPAGYWQRNPDARPAGKTLWEHNEMVAFGSAATACPSGRVPWDTILKRLATEDDMFTRYNGLANPGFWTNREINGSQGWGVRTDFKLPAGTSEVEVELFTLGGDLTLHDGGSSNVAGFLEGPGNNHYRLKLDKDGAAWLEGNHAVIAKLGILGYYG